MRTFLTAIGLTLFWGHQAAALEIETNRLDLGPFGDSKSLYLSGEIVEGDAQRVFDALESLDLKPSDRVNIVFNSPGGSLAEGIKIGVVISTRNAVMTTNVGLKGDDDDISPAGECASACVFAYVGGHYRFLRVGSKLGVHQFFFGGDEAIDSDVATSVAQSLSADIVRHLEINRVDTEFFSVISDTLPYDVTWVPRKDLEELNVVTGPVWSVTSEYKNANGQFYHLLRHVSYYGENKLMTTCGDGGPGLVAFLMPPDMKDMHWFTEFVFSVDGVDMTPERGMKIDLEDSMFVRVSFFLSEAQLRQVLKAKTIGARVQAPDGPMFVGFTSDIPDNKIKDTILGCWPTAKAQPQESDQRTLAGRFSQTIKATDIYHNTDIAGFDMTKTGFKNTSLEDCVNICRGSNQCKAVSWVQNQGWCWPKYGYKSPKRINGVYSVLIE